MTPEKRRRGRAIRKQRRQAQETMAQLRLYIAAWVESVREFLIPAVDAIGVASAQASTSIHQTLGEFSQHDRVEQDGVSEAAENQQSPQTA